MASLKALLDNGSKAQLVDSCGNTVMHAAILSVREHEAIPR